MPLCKRPSTSSIDENIKNVKKCYSKILGGIEILCEFIPLNLVHIFYFRYVPNYTNKAEFLSKAIPEFYICLINFSKAIDDC